MNTDHMSVIPRISEKAYQLASNEKAPVVVFDVPTSANKHQVKKAVESQFNVTVVNIKTLVTKGKAVNRVKNRRARPVTVTRKDTKKAYVTLKQGDRIPVFEEVKEDTKAPVKTKGVKA